MLGTLTLDPSHLHQLGEGQTVRPGQLAEWLGVSPPTVSVAIRPLVRDSLVSIGSGHAVTLTASGQAQGAAVVRRHQVAG